MNNNEITKKFRDACNLLASRVNEQLFGNCRKWYWIADDIGGICDYGIDDIIYLDDMVIILDNNLTYDQYSEWKLINKEKEYIGLKSWVRNKKIQ